MLLGIGNPVYDYIQTPWVSTNQRVLSGCSTNACLAARKLTYKASLFGTLGPDFKHRFLLDMERYGIECELLPAKTTGGFSLVYDDRGRRTLEVLGVAEAIDRLPRRLADAGTVLIGPILGEVSLSLVGLIASASTATLFLDPQGMLRRQQNGRIEHYRNPEIDKILPYFHIVKANEQEAEIITGIDPRHDARGSVEELYRLMVEDGKRETEKAIIAVVTLAEAGSVIFDGREMWTIPAYATLGRDPTGAGDTYAAGFIVAYDSDPTDLYRVGCFASAVASVMVENVGPDFPLTMEEAEYRAEKLINK
jgi:sugar/nucleoside kinase (ribokinase family)